MGILTKLIPTRLLHRVAGTDERLASEDERSLLLTVPDVIRLGYPIDFDPSIEQVVHRSFPDGSCELKYTYDPDTASPPGNHILLISRAERENTPQQALATYDLGLKAFAAGARLERTELSGTPLLRSWCGKFFAGHLVGSDGMPTATVVSLHRHRLVFSVILRNIVAQTDDDIDELVYEPALKAAEWALD